MIKLYGFGPAFNLPDPSPFVTKVDLILRANEIPYQVISKPNNLQKAPKAKLPFIEDNGELIADSVFITDHLAEHHGVDLDGWLSNEQAAIAQLVSKSLEENLYWTIVYSRWIKDDVWPDIKAQFFDPMPFPLNHLIARVARNSTRKQFLGHGMGKHNDAEISLIANKSWASLSTLLADKPFFFGDKISSLDITAFAMVSAFTLSGLKTDLGEQAKSYQNLLEFTQRVATDYYPNEITL